MTVLAEGAVVAHDAGGSLVTVVGASPQWTDGDDGTYGRFLFNFDNGVGAAGNYLWAPFTETPTPSTVASMTLNIRASWELLVGVPGRIRIFAGISLGDAADRDLSEYVGTTPAFEVDAGPTVHTMTLASLTGNSTPTSIMAQPSGIWISALSADLLSGQSVALRIHEAWIEYTSAGRAPHLRRTQRDNQRNTGRNSRQRSLRNTGYL